MSLDSTAVTTLIPTYKRNDFLFRATSFALAQSHTNLIVKIFDNDHNNELPERLASLFSSDSRVIYSKNSENIGAMENLKQCFRSVDTPYFSIQSDDDIILPHLYDDAMKIFERHPNLGFVVLETLTINENHELVYPCNHDGTLKIFSCLNPTELGSIPYVWTAMVFRQDLAGLFAEVIGTPNDTGADIRCLMRAMSRSDFAVLSKPGACFTAHRTSFSSCRADVEEGTPYYLTQLGRHLDIIYDPVVSESQRAFHRAALRKAMRKNLYPGWIMKIMEELVRDAADLDNIDYASRAIRNIRALKENEGQKWAAVTLAALHRSHLLKSIIRLAVRPYLVWKREHWRRKMTHLENTKYQATFARLRDFGGA